MFNAITQSLLHESERAASGQHPDASAQIFTIALFTGLTDTNPRHKKTTLQGLGKLLTKHDHRPEREEGPLWSPTEYKPGATREDVGVAAITSLALDFDKGASPVQFAPKWERYHHIIHSTFRSTDEKLRWRAVFPLSRPVLASEWDVIWKRLAGDLGAGHIDTSCSNISCPPARSTRSPSHGFTLASC